MSEIFTLTQTKEILTAYFTQRISNPPICIECYRYYGLENQENKCSSCYGKLPKKDYKVSYQLASFSDFNEKQIISISNINQECCICLESKELVHRFSCKCIYSSCYDCSKNLKRCPICRASCCIEIDVGDATKYYELVKNKTAKILDYAKWFHLLLLKYHTKLSGVITLHTFYVKMETVGIVFKKEMDKNKTYYANDLVRFGDLIIVKEMNFYEYAKNNNFRDMSDACFDYGLSTNGDVEMRQSYIKRHDERFYGFKEFAEIFMAEI